MIPRNGESIRKVHSEPGWAHLPSQGTSQQEECLGLGSAPTARIQCSQREIELCTSPHNILSCSRDYPVCWCIFVWLEYSPAPKTELMGIQQCSYLICFNSNQKEICPDWKRRPCRHIRLWEIGRLLHLIGKQFHIETDHKPLVPILGSKNLEEMLLQIHSHVPIECPTFLARAWSSLTRYPEPLACSPAGWSVLYWRGDQFICSTYNGLQRRSLSNTVAVLQRI